MNIRNNPYLNERWYQIQIKSTINGGTYIKTATNTKFKVSQTVGP